MNNRNSEDVMKSLPAKLAIFAVISGVAIATALGALRSPRTNTYLCRIRLGRFGCVEAMNSFSEDLIRRGIFFRS